ncbi:hypothetical protein HAX54_014919 [Datura stramonium]|uniref:Kinesin motor domain-containing protein n=1 Tax=Datura stramonium TaxID=4076 RepID=A0ABS8S2J6_DATST|nr:hypothetical protein [Datura stramonium]
MSSSRSLRSSISPFRSRKPSSSSSSSSSKRPTTPSSTTSSKFPAPPAKSFPSIPSSDCPPDSSSKDKENVTVTVRFRPLNAREIGKGDELAWYADGDYTVRNENNSKIAYSFDRVFGPATTTRHVYDVAAQHVVGGAMEGINGTVFAYGVTSSGKTHTMHNTSGANTDSSKGGKISQGVGQSELVNAQAVGVPIGWNTLSFPEWLTLEKQRTPPKERVEEWTKVMRGTRASWADEVEQQGEEVEKHVGNAKSIWNSFDISKISNAGFKLEYVDPGCVGKQLIEDIQVEDISSEFEY